MIYNVMTTNNTTTSTTLDSSYYYNNVYVVGANVDRGWIFTPPYSTSDEAPKEGDMAWLKRRVDEMCWLPS